MVTTGTKYKVKKWLHSRHETKAYMRRMTSHASQESHVVTSGTTAVYVAVVEEFGTVSRPWRCSMLDGARIIL